MIEIIYQSLSMGFGVGWLVFALSAKGGSRQRYSCLVVANVWIAASIVIGAGAVS